MQQSTQHMLCVSLQQRQAEAMQQQRSKETQGITGGEAKSMPPSLPREKHSCVHFLLAAASGCLLAEVKE